MVEYTKIMTNKSNGLSFLAIAPVDVEQNPDNDSVIAYALSEHDAAGWARTMPGYDIEAIALQIDDDHHRIIYVDDSTTRFAAGKILADADLDALVE